MSRPRVELAVGLIGLGLLVVACVAGDPTSTGFDEGGDSTLPSITAAPGSTGDDGGGTDGDNGGTNGENDEAGDDDRGEAVEGATVPDQPDGGEGTGEGGGAEAGSTTTEPPAPLQSLDAELVTGGFDQPIHVASIPGTDLLAVVEREGMVRVVDGATGDIADRPLLDLSDPATVLSSSIEQGLLGLAFSPDYANDGRVYAYWTDAAGDSVLARFDVSGGPDAIEADPDSMAVLLTVDQPAERHNAGHLHFGPDGLLYVALGDGGSGGESAQDTSNLLGTILRLDVDRGQGDATPDDNALYAIPDDNPFGDEIWVYGLRNPWRFSIDPVDGLVYIGDVGQDSFEEINVIGLDGGGTNFGWFEMEGDECFRGGCDTGGKTVPLLQYDHEQGCSVTGGHVYRGAAIPEFVGHYFFGDWCEGFVRSFRLAGDPADGRVVDQLDHGDDLAAIGQVTSFGIDGDGELLTVNWEGDLHRIVPVR